LLEEAATGLTDGPSQPKSKTNIDRSSKKKPAGVLRRQQPGRGAPSSRNNRQFCTSNNPGAVDYLSLFGLARKVTQHSVPSQILGSFFELNLDVEPDLGEDTHDISTNKVLAVVALRLRVIRAASKLKKNKINKYK